MNTISNNDYPIDHCITPTFSKYENSFRYRDNTIYSSYPSPEVRDLEAIASDLRHDDPPKEVFYNMRRASLIIHHIGLSRLQEPLHHKRVAGLFPLVNKHMKTIKHLNEELYLWIKVQFANLPLDSDRTAFPELYLTEKEKITYLLRSLQNEEKQAVTEVQALITQKKLTLSDKKPLEKLLSSKSPLLPENREALRKTVSQQAPLHWNQPEEPYFETAEIGTLVRLAKTRSFFSAQQQAPEDECFIPQWYHITEKSNLCDILQSHTLEVREEKGARGAWLSLSREEGYGSCTLALNGSVVAVDATPRCEFLFQHWRGLQKDVPLQNRLGIVSQPKGVYPIYKILLRESLVKEHFAHVCIMSHAQLDFLRNKVEELLGCPNIPKAWRQTASQERWQPLPTPYRSIASILAFGIAQKEIGTGRGR